VAPIAPGRSRIRRFDFAPRQVPAKGAGRAPREAWQRRAGAWLRQQIELAESTQAGLSGAAEESAENGSLPAELAEFRAAIAALLHAQAATPAP
jgi:hypothetical protein